MLRNKRDGDGQEEEGDEAEEGEREETRNILAHHRNSEGQMFESFKTPETGICYSGQWQQGLSVGVHGTPWAITPPITPSISPFLHCLYLIAIEQGVGRLKGCRRRAGQESGKLQERKGKWEGTKQKGIKISSGKSTRKSYSSRSIVVLLVLYSSRITIVKSTKVKLKDNI